MATTETMFPDQSDFDYDYETLRTTGVVLAVVMFVSGILIALTPGRLGLRFQRQRFLLKLYSKYRLEREKACQLTHTHTLSHTNTHTNTHLLSTVIPFMAHIPLSAG